MVPLHETIGRVLSGVLWTFMVRYSALNGVISGSLSEERRNFSSCLLSTPFHFLIQFSNMFFIRAATRGTCLGVIRRYVSLS